MSPDIILLFSTSRMGNFKVMGVFWLVFFFPSIMETNHAFHRSKVFWGSCWINSVIFLTIFVNQYLNMEKCQKFLQKFLTSVNIPPELWKVSVVSLNFDKCVKLPPITDSVKKIEQNCWLVKVVLFFGFIECSFLVLIVVVSLKKSL